MSKSKEVDITVVCVPERVTYECPHCINDIDLDYDDFSSTTGEYCDWRNSEIICPECDKEIIISSIDWD